MLRKAPLDNVMKLARDPLIRLVMQSDGLCEADMVNAFATAMIPAPANDTAALAALPGGAVAQAGFGPRWMARALPIQQGHIRIIL